MNLEKRAFLYLTRKKGKNLLLAIVFLLISFSLLAGSSVYLGIQQISKDLRSNIGASFSIRPYEQFDMDNGQVSSKGTPTIDEQSIQRVISAVGKKVVIALTIITSILGLVVLMLILTLRIRGRIQEAGILLAIGKTKQQIIGQFLLEAMILLSLGFLLSTIIFLPLADTFNSFLFDSITQATVHKNYLQPDFLHFAILFVLESLGTFVTVLVCSGAILSLKPKEILTKMS